MVGSDLRQSGIMFQRNRKFKLIRILLGRGYVPFYSVDVYWILRDFLAPCVCFTRKIGLKYSSIFENFKPLQRNNTFIVN